MTDYVDVADVAKLIRDELKRTFGRTAKFSVRSSRYSGGCDINVSWTDGPIPDAVDAIVGKYAGASFDGSTDSTRHHDTTYTDRRGATHTIRSGASYVWTNRNASPQLIADFNRRIAAVTCSTPEPCGSCGVTIFGATRFEWRQPDNRLKTSCTRPCAHRQMTQLIAA